MISLEEINKMRTDINYLFKVIDDAREVIAILVERVSDLENIDSTASSTRIGD